MPKLSKANKPPFSIPSNFASKDECDEWERNQSEVRYHSALKASGIADTTFKDASLSRCLKEASLWANSFPNCGNLVLKGRSGVGKTYTACAIALSLLPDTRCKFNSMKRILDEVKQSFGKNCCDTLAPYANTQLLILDDFAKELPTAWALEQTFEILDRRYLHGRPTIFTTQYNSKTLLRRLTSNKNCDLETAEAIMRRMTENATVLELW